MFDTFKKRLFFWKKTSGVSKEELRNIKQEGNYLTAAIDSTKGQLKPEDLERLKALTRTLQDATQRLKPD